MAQREEVGQATLAALRRYVPRDFDGRLSVFFPSKESLRFGPLSQWRSVAQSTDEYFGPDGCTGDNMLREPYASAFAELFRQCCERTAPLDGEKRSEPSAHTSPARVAMVSS